MAEDDLTGILDHTRVKIRIQDQGLGAVVQALASHSDSLGSFHGIKVSLQILVLGYGLRDCPAASHDSLLQSTIIV